MSDIPNLRNTEREPTRSAKKLIEGEIENQRDRTGTITA